jgi:prevent-host-death family protein
MAQPDEPTWSVAEAKAHFSDVVERALGDGPQVVTRRGRRTVVVVSIEEWERRTRRLGTLAEFFAASPLHDSGLVVERSNDAGRPANL